MRESIGSSLLLTLVIIFVSLIILFFVNILSYSKAFKAKNRIIEVIEEYGEYTRGKNDSAETKIKATLRDLGYQLGSCRDSSNKLNSSGYAYCVEKVCSNGSTNTSKCGEAGYYYKVTTYMQFNFPIINRMYRPSVSGETKILGRDFNY